MVGQLVEIDAFRTGVGRFPANILGQFPATPVGVEGLRDIPVSYGVEILTRLVVKNPVTFQYSLLTVTFNSSNRY